MDLSKLESLSSETLQALRDKCIEVLKSRVGSGLYRGAVAWFNDSTGKKRYIRIKRVNAKTVSGQEYDYEHGVELTMRWKVSPMMLNVIVDKKRELTSMAAQRLAQERRAAELAAADKPEADYGGSW